MINKIDMILFVNLYHWRWFDNFLDCLMRDR